MEAAAAGTTTPTNGSVRSPAAPPTVDAVYTLTFFHHQPGQQQQQRSSDTRINSSSSSSSNVAGNNALAELRAELRFPPTLSSDPSASLRGQLRRQLDGLLRRVTAVGGGGGASGGGGGAADPGQKERGDDGEEGLGDRAEWERMAMEEGVRVREGETVEDFYGEAAFGRGRGGRRRRPEWGAPQRHGIRTDRWVFFFFLRPDFRCVAVGACCWACDVHLTPRCMRFVQRQRLFRCGFFFPQPRRYRCGKIMARTEVSDAFTEITPMSVCVTTFALLGYSCASILE